MVWKQLTQAFRNYSLIIFKHELGGSVACSCGKVMIDAMKLFESSDVQTERAAVAKMRRNCVTQASKLNTALETNT